MTDGIPSEGLALLHTISGPESKGSYNVIYGGDKFSDYTDHPRKYVTIKGGPNKGAKSSAAGKYQFLASTWDAAASALGLTDFSPASQDAAAWWLAQRDYKAETGGDLLAALQSGDPALMAGVGKALNGTWTSLPGGIEQGIGKNAFATAYNSALATDAGHPVPPLGIDGSDVGSELSTTKYEYNSAGKPIDPDNGFLMATDDPRYAEASTRVAEGSPTPMPRSAASDARKATAARTALLTKGAAATAVKTPVAAPYRPTQDIDLGSQPPGRAPVAAPNAYNPLSSIRAPAKPTPGVVRTNSGISGTVAMPAGARPASIAKPPVQGLTIPTVKSASKSTSTSAPGAGVTAAQKTAMSSLTGTVAAPLAKPAPLTFTKPVYKTISVLNPAWQDDIGPGATFADLQAFTGKPSAAAAGAGATGAAAAAVPKYIEKRVLVTAAQPIAQPAARPAAVAAPKSSYLAARPVGMSPSTYYAAVNQAAKKRAQSNSTAKSTSGGTFGTSSSGRTYNADTNSWG